MTRLFKVNNPRAVQFRKWGMACELSLATSVLADYCRINPMRGQASQ